MRICPVCEKIWPNAELERCPNDGSPLYALGQSGAGPDLGPGAVVGGKYEVLSEGPKRGGAGRTFLARQQRLDRIVELRMLPRDTIRGPSDEARFLREVTTWGKLRSEHLVRLYDSGVTQDGMPYMALEVVEGGVMGERLRREGPQPFARVVTLAAHALDALAAAHDASVIHRDVSPEALLLEVTPEGVERARLTGFGLAKQVGGDDDPTAITMTGMFLGNPAYMAPEWMMRGELTPAVDLFALGITLYELLAGQRPVKVTNTSEALAAYVKGTPTPLAAHRPDVPAAFARWLERLYAFDPAQRFARAADALRALEALQDAGLRTEAVSAVAAPPEQGGPPSRAMVVGVAGLVALVGVTLWFLRG